MSNKKRKNIIIVSGPSGVGKGYLIKDFLEKHKDYKQSISATTRTPRKNEINGIDYYFMNKTEFQSKIEENTFIEYCTVHNNQYGTLKSEINNQYHMIIEIDTKGAKKIKNKKLPNTLFIFIAPPTIKELEIRLEKRQTETKESIQRRVKNAKKELKSIEEYDIVVINNNLLEAKKEFEQIILNIN